MSPRERNRLADMSQQLRQMQGQREKPLDPKPDRRNLRQQEMVKITGACAGGGKYTAKIVDNFPAAPASSSDTLVAAALGTEGAEIIVYNLDELGAATHDLETGKRMLGTAHHTTDSETGKWVYLVGSAAGSGGGFWAQITANYSVGNNIWNYSWVEQERIADGWQDLAGGRTGTANTSTAAYNSIEANNNGAGMEGNSIDVDNLADGFDLQPVQGDPVVWMREDDVAGTTAYSFSYENAVDGECEPSYGTTITPVTESYNFAATDQTVVGSASSAIDVNMYQTGASDVGQIKRIKNVGSDTLTVNPYSGDTIDGSTDPVAIAPTECLDLQCAEAGKWIIV